MMKSKKWLGFGVALLTANTVWGNEGQFVSLNLCSDRLLIEIAEPHQIVAMSPFSQNEWMMLDKINHDKPTVKTQLIDLLPYLNTTVLLNANFYPQLVAQLRSLGVNIVPLNDNPQTPDELFALLLQLGELTGNQAKAEKLVHTLRQQQTLLHIAPSDTLILSETGVAFMQEPQYQTLLALLGLTPVQNELSPLNFSLEKLILSQPNVLLTLADGRGYNERAELLNHPILQKMFKNRPLATLPLKYTYCFDHGVWQGAEKIYQQFQPKN